ncbi:MAG: DUF2291 family protein [Aeromonas sp.]
MRLTQWGAALLCSTLLLTACTVVELDADGKPIIPADPAAKASFDNLTPEQIAQQTWDIKVVQRARDTELDEAALAKAQASHGSSSQNLFVRIKSKVEQIDASNERERKLVVTVNGAPLAVHIGPVIRSNTLRDAAGFTFQDFTNQVQFAQLARAYNREAVKHLPTVDESWIGQPVTIEMAVKLNGATIDNATAIALTREAQ